MPASKAQVRRRKPAKKANGRPSKYTARMPGLILDYFETCADTQGKSVPMLKECVNTLPTLSGFARTINVTPRTLNNWAKAHPEFDEAKEHCMAIAADMVSQLALNNIYSPSISMFLLKASYGIQDKQVVEATGQVTIVFDELQKGAI